MYQYQISINGKRINYKCIIGTNSFMSVIHYSNYTIWKKTVLCFTYLICNKV